MFIQLKLVIQLIYTPDHSTSTRWPWWRSRYTPN